MSIIFSKFAVISTYEVKPLSNMLHKYNCVLEIRMKNTIQFSDIFVNIFGTHLDPSELTDSVDLCLTSFPPGAGKSGITSQLLTTPFV